jgi:hypothetical protein
MAQGDRQIDVSPRDRALWLRFQRRASQLSPDLAKALLDAWDIIREALTDAEIEKLLSGDTALLDRALIPVRKQIVSTVEKGFSAAVKDLPKAGKVDGVVALQFDVLNPKIVDAVRRLDSRVVRELSDDITETVRAIWENGLRDGTNPKVIAKDLRAVIGMTDRQEANAQKFGAKLIEQGKSQEQVDRAVTSYRKRAIAQNANTAARTGVNDSLKLGQKLTWEDAATKGIVDLDHLEKTWVSVGDDRVRDEHRAMHGQTVPFRNRYSNGDEVPGESDYGCRCVERVRLRRAA